MSSIFYFDCETCGLDPKRHGIVQIAWIIEKDGIEQIRRCFDVMPYEGVDLNLKALEVNKFTLDRINDGIYESAMLQYLFNDIKSVVGGGDGMIPCGHNVRFDLDFLNEAIQRTSHKYTINYGNSSLLKMNRPVCTLGLCHYLNYTGDLSLDNYRLETVCRHFGIPLDAHDAMGDIMATRSLLVHLNNMIGEHHAEM